MFSDSTFGSSGILMLRKPTINLLAFIIACQSAPILKSLPLNTDKRGHNSFFKRTKPD